jgi:carboxyl-terminal processing protease
MLKKSLPSLLSGLLPFLLAILLSGCAVLDPHEIVTRHIGNGPPPDGQPLDARLREQAFDYVWQRINDHYVDPNLRGVDWQAVRQRYRPLALNSANDEIFWKTLDDMTAELGDAHTRVMSSKNFAWYKKNQVQSLGLDLREVDGEMVVAGVHFLSEAALLGVRLGQKLISVDGKPVASWWQEQRAKGRKSSTERATLKSIVALFNRGDPEHPQQQVRLSLERADKTVFEVTLQRAPLESRAGVRAWKLTSGYGYLRLTGFDYGLRNAVLVEMEKIRDTRGMVLDLRGNGGGASLLAQFMAAQWVEGKVAAGRTITRTGKPIGMALGLLGQQKLELEIEGVEQPYRAPLVILLDSDSASASELLSATLQGLGRAKIVGDISCGCLLGYLGLANVPGGGALAYSEVDFAMVDGKRIEGVGVVPDLMVKPTRQDLFSGHDVQLEAALALLDKLQLVQQ